MTNDRGEHRPRVIAVVLTWNDAEMASECIRSVLGNTYPNTDVILVDNGSDPPVAGVLGQEFPSIEVLRLDRNQGFTGGCNRGIERAIERDADYVFLLNNDTVVHEAAIGELVDAAEARPDAAAASALILLQGAGQEIQFYKGLILRDAAHHVHPEATEGAIRGDMEEVAQVEALRTAAGSGLHSLRRERLPTTSERGSSTGAERSLARLPHRARSRPPNDCSRIG